MDTNPFEIVFGVWLVGILVGGICTAAIHGYRTGLKGEGLSEDEIEKATGAVCMWPIVAIAYVVIYIFGAFSYPFVRLGKAVRKRRRRR